MRLKPAGCPHQENGETPPPGERQNWNCPRCRKEQRQAAGWLPLAAVRNMPIAAAVAIGGVLLCGAPGLALGGIAAAHAAAACSAACSGRKDGESRALASLSDSRKWQLATAVCAALAAVLGAGT